MNRLIKKTTYLPIMLGILMSGMIVSCSGDDDWTGTKTIVVHGGDSGKQSGEGDDTSGDPSNTNSNAKLGASDAMGYEVPHVRTGSGIRFVSHWANTTTGSSKTTLNYCFEYDSACYHTRWVAFSFDATTNKRNVSRSDAWSVDSNLPSSWQLTPDSYSGSGYTRGHLCASADRLYSLQANEQTFYMSNMSPQLYNFNSYYWAELEAVVRNWGQSGTYNKVYVCKGGTIREGQRYGGKGYFETTNSRGKGVKVVIPKYYFMAILAEKSNSNFQGIAFLLDHKDYGYAGNYPPGSIFKQHAMSIDELESFTGIDFFCNLKDNLENIVEASYSENAWSWNGM